MKIIIPMAGYGTRMRPHTWSKPKPLISVAGKAVLGHVLDMFASLPDVDEVIFIVGYLGEQVEAYMAETYPQYNTRFVYQDEMLGQSHAIWLAREGIEGPMLMAFVDTIIETDLSGIPNEKADAVAWVKEVEDPRRFGVADIDPTGRILRLIEKPQDPSINLALVGFYYFKQAEALLDAIHTQMTEKPQLKGEWYLADAINIMLERNADMRVQPVEVWEDCGKPDALLQTNRYLLQHGRDNSNAAVQTDVAIIPPVYIDPTAVVEDSIIGPHVSIGAGCHIKRSILSDTIAEPGAEISDSILTQSLVGKNACVSGSPQSINIGDHSVVTSHGSQ